MDSTLPIVQEALEGETSTAVKDVGDDPRTDSIGVQTLLPEVRCVGVQVTGKVISKGTFYSYI